MAGSTWLRQIEHKPWEIKVSGYPIYNDIRIGNSFFAQQGYCSAEAGEPIKKSAAWPFWRAAAQKVQTFAAL